MYDLLISWSDYLISWSDYLISWSDLVIRSSDLMIRSSDLMISWSHDLLSRVSAEPPSSSVVKPPLSYLSGFSVILKEKSDLSEVCFPSQLASPPLAYALSHPTTMSESFLHPALFHWRRDKSRILHMYFFGFHGCWWSLTVLIFSRLGRLSPHITYHIYARICIIDEMLPFICADTPQKQEFQLLHSEDIKTWIWTSFLFCGAKLPCRRAGVDMLFTPHPRTPDRKNTQHFKVPSGLSSTDALVLPNRPTGD